MKSMIGLALVLSAMPWGRASGLAIGAPIASPAAEDTSRALIGQWDGTYTADHGPSGTMNLTISKDTVLKLTALNLSMGSNMAAVPVSNLAVTSTDISWTLDMMGQACTATAVEKHGEMRGSMACGHVSVQFFVTKIVKP
jgi:hypothetical protein